LIRRMKNVKKGKTIEVGKIHFSTPKRRFTLLDAPGHDKYIPNMINGACQADIGVLVVSARRGEFEAGFLKDDGRTKEHAVLCKTLGIKQIVVAINKMDDNTVNYSQERYNEIVNQLTLFMKKLNFKPTFVPVSGLCGINLTQRMSKEICSWYDGPCLLEILEDIEIEYPQGSLILPVIDKYQYMGKTFISGKIERGSFSQNQTLSIVPKNSTFTVLNIEDESVDSSVKSAKVGDDITIITNRDVNVSKGDVIVSNLEDAGSDTDIVAKFFVYQTVKETPIICPGFEAILHIHTAQVECRIKNILYKLDKKGKPSEKSPKFVTVGDSCIIHLGLDYPICFDTFEKTKQLGRFTLRGKGITFGYGTVMQKGQPVRKVKN